MTDRPALRPAQVSASHHNPHGSHQYLLRAGHLASTSCGFTSTCFSTETGNGTIRRKSTAEPQRKCVCGSPGSTAGNWEKRLKLASASGSKESGAIGERNPTA